MDKALKTMADIFDVQKTLHEGYIKIEAASGLGMGIISDNPTIILNQCHGWLIDDPRYQAVLKDYAWRVSEEICESFDARKANDPDAMIEEAIDAFTFLIELLVIADVEPWELVSLASTVVEGFVYDGDQAVPDAEPFALFCSGNGVWSDGESNIGAVQACQLWDISQIYHASMSVVLLLGRAMHMLKNRPWAQTKRSTDHALFQAQLAGALWAWFRYARTCGMTREGILAAYTRKAEVNLARQSGGY